MSEVRLKRILPDDYSRCDGQVWPDFGVQPQCIDCARRQPVSERAVFISYIDAPPDKVCPSRIPE
jgi:hypothetical protein